ncbi:restriction endonuclease subunit S [Sporolactobacillus sp. STSJ-5]|uniref:restriction endonuclease subunit S n=1 Tax=Sporolactobacillus sp. STSJ-5 TaxID=2965076 RepID=UPI0021050EE5|nr:restriction endonuclease subunit S [Sporolactobacillus sp. STSJ-5]MCQ2011299.1 restriction endonuclease subunit S [Sporolactobacillus sp. STSJ-5]
MSENNENIPKLRFPGFTDAWEQRKLGEVSERVRGNDGRMNLPTLTISAGNGWLDQRERFSGNIAGNEQKNYTLLKKEELSYNHGNSKLAKYGTVFALRTYEEALVPRVYHSFKTTQEAVPDFIEYLFATKRPDRELEKLVSSGARMDGLLNINYNDFMGIKINLPSVEEQIKISEFLRHLDQLTTLHQSKLNNLQDEKKSLLQKMFPKNGKNVPELRFPGFTHAWEQRELGDHAKYRRGSFPQPYGNKEWYDGEGAMPFVQVVDVTDQLTLVNDTKQKISKLAQFKSVFVPKGKVVVTLQGSIGRVAITQYDAYIDRTLLIFEDYEKPTDEYFWAYTIQQKFDIEKRKAPGGTIKTITKEALSRFSVALPEYEEQQKIGTFFKNLDHLITLHQRKLDHCKNLKKSLLQQMFV